MRVSRQSMMRWHRAWTAGGRKPKVPPPALAAVEAAVLQGPRASGFVAEFWMPPRVASVIERVTGGGYHPGHFWCLRRAWGCTPQRPATRARERNEAAIQAWSRGLCRL